MLGPRHMPTFEHKERPPRIRRCGALSLRNIRIVAGSIRHGTGS